MPRDRWGACSSSEDVRVHSRCHGLGAISYVSDMHAELLENHRCIADAYWTRCTPTIVLTEAEFLSLRIALINSTIWHGTRPPLHDLGKL